MDRTGAPADHRGLPYPIPSAPADPSSAPGAEDAEACASHAETPPRAQGFEDYPLSRNEYIGALVHFYRGERSRADAWRARLDPTTNWAVVTTGGMLSFAFSDAGPSHVTLLLANLLVVIFFLPIIRRNLVSPRTEWRELVAQDLDQPKFKLTFLEAVGLRLGSNYIWIFLVILVAWLAKLSLHPTAAWAASAIDHRMAIGPLGSGAVVAIVGAFYAAAALLAVWAARLRGGGDEVHGIERATERWKI